MAVDTFFEDPSRKRKRAGANGASSSRGRGRGGSSGGGSTRVNGGGHTRKGKGRAVEDSTTTASSRRRERQDEEIEGSDSDNEDGNDSDERAMQEEEFESDDEAERKETPAQKRLRLAQQYLDSLKAAQSEQVGFDAAELERDIIAERLQKDVLEVSGKLHLRIADKLSYTPASSATTSNRVHRLPLTCAVTSEDCKYLFTASKDGSIAQWDISRFTLPSSSSSSSLTTSTEAEASTSTSSSNPLSAAAKSSTPEQPKIVKLDFQPKRLPVKKRKNTESKGKAAIARNQPSQDVDSHGHTDEIYSLAISGDGTRLASGGKDRRICVWDITPSSSSSSSTSVTANGSAKTNGHVRGTSQASANRQQGCKWISSLRGHKDSISSLKFRMGTNQLYTSSFDRTLKIYDIQSLSYIETLFGHQDKIYDLNVLRNELAVTAGGRDKTLRYWKIKDETQLVFRAGGTSKIRSVLEGGLDDIENDDDDNEDLMGKKKVTTTEKKFVEGSVDCTAMIDDTHFVSGGDSGTISLWSVNKKKPIFSVPIAHGINEYASESEGIIGNPRWIISLSSLPYSDLFASGSYDGTIRLWRISDDIKSFNFIASIPALGHVNSIQLHNIPAQGKKGKKNMALVQKGRVLITAALGQEHKFGRWMKVKEAKNQALLAILEESA